MSVENDVVRLRQELARLGKSQNLYTTYHSADLDAKPVNPTGDGEGNGWTKEPTNWEEIRWMSIKRASSVDGGTWSNPFPIRGADGIAGGYLEYIFKRSEGMPVKPNKPKGTGGIAPNDWYDAPPPADGNPLWVCTCWKAADGSFAVGVTEWADPVRLEGEGISVQYSEDGSTNWHDTFITGDLYMRVSTDGKVTWSDAIRIVGEDGKDGSFLGPLSDDIPEVSNVRFVVSNGNLAWAGGTIEYGGNTYLVNGNPTGLDKKYVYWDQPDSTPGEEAVLRGTDDLAEAIDITTSGHWLLCKRENGKAYPANPFKVIQSEAILAASLSAISANLGTVTAGEILFSGKDGSPASEDTARYQLKINAGGTQGRWRGSGLPAWKDTESGTAGSASYNSGWRKIIDITDNQVKVSFDSYNSGEEISGVGPLVNVGSTLHHTYPETAISQEGDYNAGWATLSAYQQEVIWNMNIKAVGAGGIPGTVSCTPYLRNSSGTIIWTGDTVGFHSYYDGSDWFSKMWTYRPALAGIGVGQQFRPGVHVAKTTTAYFKGTIRLGDIGTDSIYKK